PFRSVLNRQTGNRTTARRYQQAIRTWELSLQQAAVQYYNAFSDEGDAIPCQGWQGSLRLNQGGAELIEDDGVFTGKGIDFLDGRPQRRELRKLSRSCDPVTGIGISRVAGRIDKKTGRVRVHGKQQQYSDGERYFPQQ